MRFAVILGLLALSKSTSVAQSTNLVQRANFVLRGTTQTASGVKRSRLGNKDILAALNETGEFNFGPKATLLLVSSNDRPAAIVVHEKIGQQMTNTDVGAYFSVTEIGGSVRSSNDKTRWETWSFDFNNGTTNETAFQLWGAATIHRGSIRAPDIGTISASQRVESNVRGVGRVQGAITIFSGTVSGEHTSLFEEGVVKP